MDEKITILEKLNEWASIVTDGFSPYVAKGGEKIALPRGKQKIYVSNPTLEKKPETVEECEKLIDTGDVIIIREKDIKRYRDQIEEIREKIRYENLHVTRLDYDWETGLTMYGLSARIPPSEWAKIKHLMQWCDLAQDEDSEWESDYRGWFTTRPEEVEKILKIPEERTLAHKKEVQARDRAKRKNQQEKKNKMLREIDQCFIDAEKPDPKTESPVEAKKYMKGYEKMTVAGEEIQHPIHPKNIYGGGQWWVIQGTTWIWKIENNGSDGDAWDLNNIETGGAGAIGTRVPYSQKLADLIRKTANLKQGDEKNGCNM